MLKRTLFFASSGTLKMKQKQLLFEPFDGALSSIPIEDIGFVVVESSAITISTSCIQELMANNVVCVFCDEKHMPNAMLLAVTSHSTAQRQIEAQLSATEALKDRLWKQTVAAKIRNQGECLSRAGKAGGTHLKNMARNVKNGDPKNLEAIAAKLYFSRHFPDDDFARSRFGNMPNAILNYGYAIVRAATARALVGSGLLCVSGIHHANQYNPYGLADDIMEPYRPFLDDIVLNTDLKNAATLDAIVKRALLSVLTVDVKINGMKRPLMNALSITSASLARTFLKEDTAIVYPEFP